MEDAGNVANEETDEGDDEGMDEVEEEEGIQQGPSDSQQAEEYDSDGLTTPSPKPMTAIPIPSWLLAINTIDHSSSGDRPPPQTTVVGKVTTPEPIRDLSRMVFFVAREDHAPA
ncbi:MAG: hypothetical protein Q9198_009836 [Flavoplaca austrocitrina]